MKLVLDTNVVVSAAISSQGLPSRIVAAVLRGDVGLIIDDRIAVEYLEVLSRSHLPGPVERRIKLGGDLLMIADYVEAKEAPADLQLPDPDDAPFLLAAISAAVDHLISGNIRHFPPAQRRGVSVLSPREFADRYPALV